MDGIIKTIRDRGIGVSLFAVYTICTSMALDHADTTLSTPLIHIVFVVIKCAALFGAIILFLFYGTKSIDKNAIWYFLPFLFFLFLSQNLSVYGILSFGLFALFNPSNKYNIFLTYRDYLVISSFFGIIVYISFVVGIPFPNTMVPYYGDSMGFYVNYGFAYLHLSLDGLRLCGLFNEPGYFGTILALTLISTGFEIKRTSNIIMLIAGCLTMSMAFFTLIGLYTIIVNIFHPQRLVVFALILFVVCVILVKIGIVPESMVDHIIGRFAFDDGKFAGDNRSSSYIDEALEFMLDTPYKWFGYGDKLPVETEGSLTYKTHILQFGIVGSLLTWGSLLFASLKCLDKSYNSQIFIFLFFISIYQRPGIYTLCYFVILFGGIIYQNKYTKLNIYE